MKNDPAMLALSYPFECGLLSVTRTGRWAVLYAQAPLPAALPDGADFYTPWKLDSEMLARPGLRLLEDTDALEPGYDVILLRMPPQRESGLGLLAQAWAALSRGGILVAAAANDAGGRRLEDDLKPYCPGLQTASKHKCRIVWATKTAETLPSDWVARAAWQKDSASGLWTRPGLFSWDRVDTGTGLLLRHLPNTFKGAVADFGCGVGVIGHHLLTHNRAITTLSAIDADRRAVTATLRNLEAVGHTAALVPLWADMTRTLSLPRQDAIVMNPPFHKDKAENIALGQSCALQARSCLKHGGSLWMVANTHLPYETLITGHFTEHALIARENGFKVIHAIA